MQWICFNRLVMNERRGKASSHLQTPKRPSPKGTMPANLTPSCTGRILVHCPSGNSVPGSVKHSAEPSLSPPATTNFPEAKAAPWLHRGIKSGLREIHPAFVGSPESHGQRSISTAPEGSYTLVSPPTANIRPSGSQFRVSPPLANFNGWDSCHLKKRTSM